MLDLVLVAIAGAVALYLLLTLASRERRTNLGVQHGTVVAADDSRLPSPTLRSERLGLIGRPDHLLRVGGAVIPVEQKPSATRLQPSHVLQVAAQCLLVEDVYGVRPAYGLVVLAGGRREQVAFTPALERSLLKTMIRMRALLANGVEPGPRWVAPKCRACGFRSACWSDQALAAPAAEAIRGPPGSPG